MSAAFVVTERPITLADALNALGGDAHGDDAHGGVVTFTGVVRRHSRGKEVVRLEYEAYVPMAERTLRSIAAQAQAANPEVRVAIWHRIGTLGIGEIAVVIAASAPHRGPAFEACRFAIEELKRSVPIWKKEIFTDGQEWVGLGP